MTSYAAFLRGINVGGNNTLSMKDLAALCAKAGLSDVRTYINSGNALFKSDLPEADLEALLERSLEKKMGKRVVVVVKNVADVEKILKKHPFPKADPARVGVLLSAKPVSKKVLAEFIITGPEEIAVGKREVYVHYPEGMGRSVLKWPLSLKGGTVRNINTLRKLVELASKE